jgi:hypothetical protein
MYYKLYCKLKGMRTGRNMIGTISYFIRKVLNPKRRGRNDPLSR